MADWRGGISLGCIAGPALPKPWWRPRFAGMSRLSSIDLRFTQGCPAHGAFVRVTSYDDETKVDRSLFERLREAGYTEAELSLVVDGIHVRFRSCNLSTSWTAWAYTRRGQILVNARGVEPCDVRLQAVGDLGALLQAAPEVLTATAENVIPVHQPSVRP
jgi:hypothetical protein